MPQSNVVYANARERAVRGWGQAYLHFLASPSEHFSLKLGPLIVLGVVPLSIADDFLVPFLGVADDIPTSLLIAFIVVRTWLRVRTHRYQD